MHFPSDVLVGRTDEERRKSIGERVRLYRECADLTQSIFAERVGISLEDLQEVENGNVYLSYWLLLKLSETLNVGYSDLFEDRQAMYYQNIREISSYFTIREKVSGSQYDFKDIAKHLETKVYTVKNWLRRSYIPSPFNFQNLLTLVNFTSNDLQRPAIIQKVKVRGRKPKPVKEPKTNPEKEAAPVEKFTEPKAKVTQNDIIVNVVNACNLYMRMKELSSALDEIINKAQDLKKILEQYK